MEVILSVDDGDQIGGMYFNAADGTDVNSYAAQIAAESMEHLVQMMFQRDWYSATTSDGAAHQQRDFV